MPDAKRLKELETENARLGELTPRLCEAVKVNPDPKPSRYSKRGHVGCIRGQCDGALFSGLPRPKFKTQCAARERPSLAKPRPATALRNHTARRLESRPLR